MRFARLLSATLYATIAFAQAASAEGPIRHVIVTLPPLLPLVEAVTDGVITPEALGTGNGDAHTMLVTPSQAEKIAKADVIIIDDVAMNMSLTRLVNKRQQEGATIIAFTELEGADPRPYGKENEYTKEVKPEKAPTAKMGSVFDKPKAPSKHDADGGGLDPHIWLDPIRMSRAVKSLGERFAELDVAHAETYRFNAKQLSEHLVEQVDPAIANILGNTVASDAEDVIPFITYHDAYRYFYSRYGLDKAGYVTQRPEEYIGAASMKALMEASRSQKVRCLIAEGKGPMTQRLAMQSEATVIQLNPEMLYEEKDTPQAAWALNAYDRLLAKIAKTFADCIEGKKG